MTEQKKQSSHSSKLRQFISYYEPHRKLFFLDLFCAFWMALIDLSFPLVTRSALQNLLPAGASQTFFLVIAALAVAYMLRAGFQYIVTYWGHTLGVRMEADMREDLFKHLQTLSFRFYDSTRTGHLLSRLVNDLFDITELAHHGPEDLFISTLTFIGAFIAMLFIEWRLALILVAVLPIMLIFTASRRMQMSKASRELKIKTADINAQLENSLSGIRASKAFSNEKHEVGKFFAQNKRFKASKSLFYRAMGVFQSGMEFITNLLNVVIVGAGGLFILQGTMDLADMLAFTLYVNAFLQPIRKLTNFVEQYQSGMAGFERFTQLLSIQPDIVDSPGAQNISIDHGAIDFSNVSFAYENGLPVLSNIDLHIDAGKKIALVGPSGAGKTTLCHLIPRFYEPISGEIRIDGHPLNDFTLSSLRMQVGIVQQDVFLFSASIRENIRYGRLTASDAEIETAAMKAEIHDFITSLPNGYDTNVGERGILLSGGQKQRIAIARIFLKSPSILILDEATSALDSDTQARIQRALDTLSAGRTTLIIAHRLSTIRNADCILVLDGSRITECGTHASLLQAGGLYTKLYGSHKNS